MTEGVRYRVCFKREPPKAKDWPIAGNQTFLELLVINNTIQKLRKIGFRDGLFSWNWITSASQNKSSFTAKKPWRCIWRKFGKFMKKFAICSLRPNLQLPISQKWSLLLFLKCLVRVNYLPSHFGVDNNVSEVSLYRTEKKRTTTGRLR